MIKGDCGSINFANRGRAGVRGFLNLSLDSTGEG